MKFDILFELEEERLRQEIELLLSTRAGSVPIDRDYGIDWQCLDAPPEVGESLFYQELLQKTEKYVPDIRIKGVDFVHNQEKGEMAVKINCERRGDSE